MKKYRVTITPRNGGPATTKDVEAENMDQASYIVVEAFKGTQMAIDAVDFDVKVEELPPEHAETEI